MTLTVFLKLCLFYSHTDKYYQGKERLKGNLLCVNNEWWDYRCSLFSLLYFFVITVCYFYNLKKIDKFYFKITLGREPRIIPGSLQLCLESEKLQSHISRLRAPLMITQLGTGLKAVGFQQAAPARGQDGSSHQSVDLWGCHLIRTHVGLGHMAPSAAADATSLSALRSVLHRARLL